MTWRVGALVCLVILSGFGWIACRGTKTAEAVCEKACYPNSVDRIYGKQCFCKADIVIREMPNEEVPDR